MVNYRPVTVSDVAYVATHMRDADRAEVAAMSGRTPLHALARSVQRSERSATIEIDGAPVAVFGIVRYSLTSVVGAPWLLGTDGVPDNTRVLLRDARRKLPSLSRGFAVLRNHVHADNTAAVRWLRHMGFDLSTPAPVGRQGALFHEFTKRV